MSERSMEFQDMMHAIYCTKYGPPEVLQLNITDGWKDWPINMYVPASFAEVESKWPNYFCFEPDLHFGVMF